MGKHLSFSPDPWKAYAARPILDGLSRLLGLLPFGEVMGFVRCSKENGQDEIRFSWWKDGKMIPRPLDLSESDLIKLLGSAIQAEVFTPEFRSQVKNLL